MSDITMCMNGKDCPKHEECYRYMARPDDVYQSYAMFYTPGQHCDVIWLMKNEERR